MDIRELGTRIKGKKALVLGDMMLDSYQWGKVQRISPEAPVPVIEINREEYRLGGAANVALNLKSLGADVFALGIIGTQSNAQIMRKLFKQHGLNPQGLIKEKDRKTTIKTRIGAVNQQIVRIDIEDTREPAEPSRIEILQTLDRELEQADLLIIEDYNKGLLSADIIRDALKLAKRKKVTIAVDPKHKNFFLYRNVDIFKPNYNELQTNLGTHFETQEEFFAGARYLQNKISCKYLVITMGSRGMYIFTKNAEVQHLPSCAREVYDVSGAGDTVISALGLAYAAGSDIFEAASFANRAAGVVCGKLGTASADIQEIIDYARS